MDKKTEPKFYVLEKVIYDSVNKNYAEVWNQMLVRPCMTDPDKYRDLLSGKCSGQIEFLGAVLFQDKEETEDEFLLRAACQGYNVKFIISYVRTEGWNQYSVNVVDEENNIEYDLPLPADVVETDEELKKWA